MRETLHFVAARDLRSILGFRASRLISSNAGRYRALGLETADFARARRIFTRALRDGARLSRPAAYEALARGGVSPAGQRGIHIIGHLAQEGLICFGPRDGKQPTFVLLDAWVPRHTAPSREEALARLATAYFRSHGPATLQDFAWWSGLLMKDARAAIQEAGSALVAETRGDRTTWVGAGAPHVARRGRRPVAALLPPWDEYLVAYRDRRAALGHLATDPPPMVIGNSVLVIDGRARGTWKRSLVTVKGRPGPRVAVTVEFWSRATEAERRATLGAVERYARFVGGEAVASIRTGARTRP
jgi:hypothetical protein